MIYLLAEAAALNAPAWLDIVSRLGVAGVLGVLLWFLLVKHLPATEERHERLRQEDAERHQQERAEWREERDSWQEFMRDQNHQVMELLREIKNQNTELLRSHGD